MDDQILMLFVASVFATVFILSQALILPTLGSSGTERKRLKQRFDYALSGMGTSHQSIIKARSLDKLPPILRKIESLPLMNNISVLLEHAGKGQFAYKFVFFVLAMAFAAGVITWLITHHFVWTLGITVSALVLPFAWLKNRSDKYLDQFEEQLPEALEMMARTLRTGFPFIQCFQIVASEMDGPVSKEFGITFEELNYGREMDIAFALMVERVPSLSLTAMVTAILIQKETGGNLSEVLLNISSVLRDRFKLERTVKTLSAEGIFSAWVLCLMPFFMFLAFNIINPEHFDALYEHPEGYKLFYIIAVLEGFAIVWIRKIVNIDV